MLFIFGIRAVRIGNFIDTDHMCYRCRSFEREVNFYQSYFHFCYIPVFPVGRKKIEIRCKNCGDETQTEALMEKYTKAVKTPLWFYSAIFLSILIAVIWLYWHQTTEKHNRNYIANPLAGDVYTIKEEKNTGNSYYFLRVIEKKGDTILALQSNFEYGYPIDHLEADDFFVKSDTLHFGKEELNEMLDKGQIYSVSREGAKEEGFNRIK
jgi:hypothetical protein